VVQEIALWTLPWTGEGPYPCDFQVYDKLQGGKTKCKTVSDWGNRQANTAEPSTIQPFQKRTSRDLTNALASGGNGPGRATGPTPARSCYR